MFRLTANYDLSLNSREYKVTLRKRFIPDVRPGYKGQAGLRDIHCRIDGPKRLSDIVIGFVPRLLQVDKGLGGSRQPETSSLFGVRTCGLLNWDVSHRLQNGRGRVFQPLNFTVICPKTRTPRELYKDAPIGCDLAFSGHVGFPGGGAGGAARDWARVTAWGVSDGYSVAHGRTGGGAAKG
jgi:hypothetical protein